MNKNELNRYRVAYRDENRRLRYKVITAKTNTGALIRFKRLTRIKAIYAKQVLTKEDRICAGGGRATYFDGRALCYCDTDGVVGMENGYWH